MRAELIVTFAGPLVTLQDAGRSGLMRFGVPRSGPMDTRSLAIANAALGNPSDACGIEVSLGGLQLNCAAGSVTFAIAGGQFEVTHGTTRLAPWAVATLHHGQSLTIRPGDHGSWAMLVFAGQIEAATWLNGRATHSQSGFGGGSVLTGSRITIDNAETRPDREGDLPIPGWALPASRFAVVAGPQDRFFDPATFDRFLTEPFTLSDAYDRMGVRLKGPHLPVNAALDMPSEPTLRGSVQVAGDGVATVLLADHQTTGGYPKIATVIAPDLNRLVQRRSGDSVRFHAVTPDEAILAARQARTDLQAYLHAIATPRGNLTDRLMSANLISGVYSDD